MRDGQISFSVSMAVAVIVLIAVLILFLVISGTFAQIGDFFRRLVEW